MPDKESNSILSSLDDSLDFGDADAGPAKVKNKEQKKAAVKNQKWVSDDSASSLLGDLLDRTAEEAEEERRRVEAELRAREEAEARAQAEAEARRRDEGAQRLAEERRRKEEVERKRAETLEAIERDRKIAAGEIDPAAEARAAAEAEAANQRELELQTRERVARDQHLNVMEQRFRDQEAQLKRLTEASLQPVEPIEPPRSNAGLIAALVVLLLGGGAAAAYFLVLQPPPPTNTGAAVAQNALVLQSEDGSVNLQIDKAAFTSQTDHDVRVEKPGSSILTVSYNPDSGAPAASESSSSSRSSTSSSRRRRRDSSSSSSSRGSSSRRGSMDLGGSGAMGHDITF